MGPVVACFAIVICLNMKKCTTEPLGFFGRWRKRRALRKQVRTIGRDLQRKHGKNNMYSTRDIQSAWQDRGYSLVYMCYAMAAYSSPSDFHDYHSHRGENCDYNAMRSEVSHACFHGTSDFTDLGVSSDHSADCSSDFSSGGDSGASSDGGDCGGGD